MEGEQVKTGTGDVQARQTVTAPATTGTTAAEPAGKPAGQPAGTSAGTTGDTQAAGTQATTEETFFDPKALEGKPELQAAYKEMQRAFTRKTQEIKAHRQKIEAYDAFSADPIGQMQAMASRMGFKLSRAEAAAAVHDQQQAVADEPVEPKTWEDVRSWSKSEAQKAAQEARAAIMKELAPVLEEYQTLKKTNIEKALDSEAPDWRTYEDEMMANLKAHPTLVNNPMALYRLSVPPEVLASRAAQAAIKKIETKASGAKASGASTTTKKPKAVEPDRPLSFKESVAWAEAKLAEQGIRA